MIYSIKVHVYKFQIRMYSYSLHYSYNQNWPFVIYNNFISSPILVQIPRNAITRVINATI